MSRNSLLYILYMEKKNKGSSLSQTVGLFCKDLWYLLDTPSLLAERMGVFLLWISGGPSEQLRL